MNNIKKAEVAQIKYAGFEFEGLLLPDGSYGIAATQAWEILKFSDHPQNASRDLKRLMGEGFQTFLCASELNPKKVKVISLADFGIIVMRLAFKGNKVAQAIAEASVETTILQAFDIAFNKKKDLKNYNEFLKVRTQGKIARRNLTDAIKEYIHNHPHQEDKWIYANCTNAIYSYVLGATAKEIRKLLEIKPSQEIRDSLDTAQLIEVERLEEQTRRIIDSEYVHPLEAVEKAIVEARCVRLKLVKR